MQKFLINYDLYKTEYMAGSQKYNRNRIVMAANENEAIAKLNAYYDNKNKQYCVYYSIEVNYVTEAI
jgi:hypothetical protein